MASVASLVANPVFLRNPRPKFNPAKPTAGRHACVSLSSSSAPKLNVDVKLKSFFSTVENNQYCSTITTTDSSIVSMRPASQSKKITRPVSMCKTPNAIKEHLGIGKPLGRVGGKWSTAYPYDPKSDNPSESPWPLVPGCILILLFLAAAVRPYLPIWCIGLYLILLGGSIGTILWSYGLVSVVKLQVGFSGKGRRALGLDLNQIAESADTSSYKGLSYVLNETMVALLRHHEYYNSSFVSVVPKCSREAAQIYIDQICIDERIKNKETLVNVNNTKLQSPTSQESDNDEIMVTLFVGAKGKLELPTIHDKYDLKKVLRKLRAIGSSNDITAVEVLWTPQTSPCSAPNDEVSS